MAMSGLTLSRFGSQLRPRTSLQEIAVTLDTLSESKNPKGLRVYEWRRFDNPLRVGEGSSFVVDVVEEPQIHRHSSNREPAASSVSKDGNLCQKSGTGKKLLAVKRTMFSITGRRGNSASAAHYSFDEQLDILHLEIRALTHKPLAHSRNVVDMIGYGWNTFNGILLPFIAVEYAEFGTLDQYLRTGNTTPLYEKTSLLADVSNGLALLHSCKIVHGNMKMQNVLLFHQDNRDIPVAKLSDFGHTILSRSSTGAYQPVYGGTAVYNAPELFSQDLYPIAITDMPKCDIYSFGLLIWGVLKNGDIYFEDSWLQDPQENRIDFLKSLPPHFLIKESHSFVDEITFDTEMQRDDVKLLLSDCLDYRPQHRADAATINFHFNTILGAQSEHIPITAGLEEVSPLTDMSGLHLGPIDFLRASPAWPAELRRETFNSYKHQLPEDGLPGLALLRRSECHAIGFGTPEDVGEALKSFHASALEGFVPAQVCLTRLIAALAPETNEPNFQSTHLLQIDQTPFLSSVNQSLPPIDAPQFYSTLTRTVKHLMFEKYANAKKSNKDLQNIFGSATPYVESQYGAYRLASERGPFDDDPQLQLYSAVVMNDAQRIRMIMKINPNLISEYAPGMSPLVDACVLAHPEALYALIDGNARADVYSHQGHSPLHYLCLWDNKDIPNVIRVLKNAGANIEAVAQVPVAWLESFYIAWGTPLHFAVAANNIFLVEQLLKFGADPTASTPWSYTDLESHFTPLHLSVGLHLADMTECLLKSGNYSFPGSWPMHVLPRGSPFHKWMIHGKNWKRAAADTIKVLLNHGHSINQHDFAGRTPLEQTVVSMSTTLSIEPILRALLDHGADPNALLESWKGTMLHRAIDSVSDNSDNAGAVPLLLSYGTDPNIPNSEGETPLMMACRSGACAAALSLIASDASVFARDRRGNTALHHAAGCSASDKIMAALLNAGLSIDVRNALGSTALGVAVAHNNLGIVETLLSFGADLLVCNGIYGGVSTILDYAFTSLPDPKRMIFHLLGPDVGPRREQITFIINRPMVDGYTSLHGAIFALEFVCVRELVEAGADIKAVTTRFGAPTDAIRLVELMMNIEGYHPRNDQTSQGAKRWKIQLRKIHRFLVIKTLSNADVIDSARPPNPLAMLSLSDKDQEFRNRFQGR